MTLDRRTLLASLAALPLAGCSGQGERSDPNTNGTTEPGGESEPDLPPDCPTTQGLDVEWPAELDASTVETFLETYEHVYYRDVVVEYEPETTLDDYALSVSIDEGPRAVDGGFEATLSGGGGVYRPTLHLTATVEEPPGDTEPVPMSEIETSAIGQFLERAVEDGEAQHHVERRGDSVQNTLQRFEAAAEHFSLAGRGDQDAFHVDVNGTTVELVVQADSFHGDYWWSARYYVDKHVVRRTTDEETDPREGTLLECRTPD